VPFAEAGVPADLLPWFRLPPVSALAVAGVDVVVLPSAAGGV
jgi:hypothetical protein